MNPTQQQILQALAQRSAPGNMGQMQMIQRQIPETVPQGLPPMTPQALQARNALQQLQMMRRLGSPIYANSLQRGNSPLSPGSPAEPATNPFNAQAAQAFAPVAPTQPTPGR
jgi:hypothetical protein